MTIYGIGQRHIPFVAEVAFVIQNLIFPDISNLRSGPGIGSLNLFIIHQLAVSTDDHCKSNDPKDRRKNEKVTPFFPNGLNDKIEKNSDCDVIAVSVRIMRFSASVPLPHTQ